MDVFYSELCLIGKNPAENVRAMRDAGATDIELMLDGAGWESFHDRIDELAAKLRIPGISYSVHVPVWEGNLTSRNAFVREGVLQSYCASIRMAAAVGASQLVVHPGFCYIPNDDKVELRKICSQLLERLFDFNRGYGLRLLIENVGTNTTSLFTKEEYIDFCKGLPPEGGSLIDVGHAHVNGWDISQLILGVKDNLCALHLHDNNGDKDSHLPIGEGSIDWPTLAAAVKSLDSCPSLILEYDIGNPLEKLAQGRQRICELMA